MQTAIHMKKKFEDVFKKNQASVLAEVITDAYSELVKTSDFNELKGIVKELAEAQNRTEARVEELAEAQNRTEARVGELAEAQKDLVEAQKRTEIKVGELADDMKVLAISLDRTRGELGGLSRSVSYGFENEAYRMLPKFLKKTYGIEIKRKLVRAEIAGKEINVFGVARKNGQDAILVGEVKLRLDDRRKKRGQKDVFAELEEKVEAVRQEYKKEQIVKILVTHYATKGFMKKAEKKGVVVVQSFEW